MRAFNKVFALVGVMAFATLSLALTIRYNKDMAIPPGYKSYHFKRGDGRVKPWHPQDKRSESDNLGRFPRKTTNIKGSIENESN